MIFLGQLVAGEQLLRRSTLTGLTWGTSYSAYIRSTDIYGGTNSTADTASVSQTTTAAGYTARFDSSISVTNNYYYAGWGADSAYTDWGSVCGTPGYANDGNTGTVWVSNTSTSGRAGWTGWFSISTVEPPGGAFLDGAYITSVRVRTAKQHNNVYLGIYTAYSGAWSDNTSDGLGNDPYYGTSVISVMNSQGSGLESTFSLPFEIKIRDSANSGAGGTLGYAGHFRLRLTGDAKSYQGDYCVPASGSGTAAVRFGLLEVDFTVVVRRYTPAYNY
jgi:hypothetical protein